MFKGIIFDLDGTILDTSQDLTAAVNNTRTYFHLPPVSVKQVLDGLGNGFVVLLEKTIPEIEAEKTLPVFKEEYRNCYLDKTSPYPGIPEILKILQKKGILLAVNSNKDDLYSKNLIQKNFPELEFVDVIGTTAQRKKKPDPEGANEIIQKMNVLKKEVIYCGDSEVDIKTSLNAEVTSLSVTWGFRSREELLKANAKNLINKPEELLKFFE